MGRAEEPIPPLVLSSHNTHRGLVCQKLLNDFYQLVLLIRVQTGEETISGNVFLPVPRLPNSCPSQAYTHTNTHTFIKRCKLPSLACMFVRSLNYLIPDEKQPARPW